MDLAHLHLALNHVPVIGLGIGLLILGYAFFRREPAVERVGLTLLVLLALVSFVVMQTGEPAEERVENLPGVTESVIERHEDAAKQAMLAVVALGLVALAGLVAFRRPGVRPRAYAIAVLAITLFAGGLMARASNLGGQVRHTEIRAGAVAGNTGELGTEAGETEEDEERD